MAIDKIKVSQLPKDTDPKQFEVFGQDTATGQSAKASMADLVGPVGPAPDLKITVHTIASGQSPTVSKSGPVVSPTFTIGFPLQTNYNGFSKAGRTTATPVLIIDY